MTGRDLIAARGKLVGTGYGSVRAMARRLGTPYRTYQGWEARKGSLPGVVGVAVESLLELHCLAAEATEEWTENEATSEALQTL